MDATSFEGWIIGKKKRVEATQKAFILMDNASKIKEAQMCFSGLFNFFYNRRREKVAFNVWCFSFLFCLWSSRNTACLLGISSYLISWVIWCLQLYSTMRLSPKNINMWQNIDLEVNFKSFSRNCVRFVRYASWFSKRKSENKYYATRKLLALLYNI